MPCHPNCCTSRSDSALCWQELLQSCKPLTCLSCGPFVLCPIFSVALFEGFGILTCFLCASLTQENVARTAVYAYLLNLQFDCTRSLSYMAPVYLCGCFVTHLSRVLSVFLETYEWEQQ